MLIAKTYFKIKWCIHIHVFYCAVDLLLIEGLVRRVHNPPIPFPSSNNALIFRPLRQCLQCSKQVLLHRGLGKPAHWWSDWQWQGQKSLFLHTQPAAVSPVHSKHKYQQTQIPALHFSVAHKQEGQYWQPTEDSWTFFFIPEVPLYLSYKA